MNARAFVLGWRIRWPYDEVPDSVPDGYATVNLFDLIKRNDRSVCLLSGDVQERTAVSKGRKHFAVRFAPSTELKLESVHDFFGLRTFPKRVGWDVVFSDERRGKRGNGFRLLLCDPVTNTSHLLCSIDPTSSSEVHCDWPMWAGRAEQLDLHIRNDTTSEVDVLVGPLHSSSASLVPILKGYGVEVGPGPSPVILPSDEVQVRYVESLKSQDWMKTYNPGRTTSRAPLPRQPRTTRVAGRDSSCSSAPRRSDCAAASPKWHTANKKSAVRTCTPQRIRYSPTQKKAHTRVKTGETQ